MFDFTKIDVPLCPICHTALHHNGDEMAFLAAHGIDGRAEAMRLHETWRALP